jgi:hypothetical protein
MPRLMMLLPQAEPGRLEIVIPRVIHSHFCQQARIHYRFSALRAPRQPQSESFANCAARVGIAKLTKLSFLGDLIGRATPTAQRQTPIGSPESELAYHVWDTRFIATVHWKFVEEWSDPPAGIA